MCGRICPAELSCHNENEVDDAAAQVSITTPGELKCQSANVNRLLLRLRVARASDYMFDCWLHPQLLVLSLVMFLYEERYVGSLSSCTLPGIVLLSKV